MVIAMRNPPFVSELARNPDFEERCSLFLVRLRWPDAVLCIRCGGSRVFSFERRGRNGAIRHLFECPDCRYQFSPTTGTIFHNSHLPLRKWFLAIQRISSANRRVAAKQLERELAVSYETAWKVTRRIRVAMEEDEAFRLKFSGISEIWSARRSDASAPMTA
jgi:transposase-like protein